MEVSDASSTVTVQTVVLELVPTNGDTEVQENNALWAAYQNSQITAINPSLPIIHMALNETTLGLSNQPFGGSPPPPGPSSPPAG